MANEHFANCYAKNVFVIYLWVNKLVLHFMGQLTTGRIECLTEMVG